MIPLRDENPTQTIPWVTIILIATNIALFLYSQTYSGMQFMASAVMVPKEIIGAEDPMRHLQADSRVVTTYALMPVWITIFSSMFLHAGWLHLGGNMLYLWIFGNNIEDNIGHIRFLLFYLVCGVAAAAAHIFSNPDSTIPTLGASGAIAGVLGAYLLLYAGARILTLLIIPPFIRSAFLPAWLVLGFWFVLQLLESQLRSGPGHVGGGVAYWAHIGGFIAGMVLIFVFGGKRQQRRTRRYYDRDLFGD